MKQTRKGFLKMIGLSPFLAIFAKAKDPTKEYEKYKLPTPERTEKTFDTVYFSGTTGIYRG